MVCFPNQGGHSINCSAERGSLQCPAESHHSRLTHSGSSLLLVLEHIAGKSHLPLHGLKQYEQLLTPQERFSFTSAVSCLAKTCKTSSKWKYIIHPHDYFINLHGFSTVFSHAQKVSFFSFYSSQIMNKSLLCTDIKHSLSPAQCQSKDSQVLGPSLLL